MLLRASLIGSAFLFVSCATLFTGTRDEIKIQSEPPGANVFLNNEPRGSTPVSLSVSRKSRPDMEVRKPGYKDGEVTLRKQFNIVALLNLTNLLFWVVDVVTGSINVYEPKYYTVRLVPEGPAPAKPLPVVEAPVVVPVPERSDVKRRMVFFDVAIHSKNPALVGKGSVYGRVIGLTITQNQDIEVLDQGTRDTLLLQRKFKLEDCEKSECRFAMAKSMPGIDLMLEADIDEIGGECLITMQTKSTKNGTLQSSDIRQVACEPNLVLNALQQSARAVWPPIRK